MRLPLALLLALLPTTAFAADKPAIDLVATFMTGVVDGSTLAFGSGQYAGTVKQTGPGAFETQTDNSGPLVDFSVTQKADCVFDIVFSLNHTAQGGIELDAHKLKSVTYGLAKQEQQWTDWAITLNGTDDAVVQNIGTDGKLSPAVPNSIISSSLKDTDMQAAVTALQAGACPAAK
jgi:hypothetical protein